MSTELTPYQVPLTDMTIMAEAFARSGLFSLKTADQAMALMLISAAEGRHPAKAAQEYHIIQGQPALRSDAKLARFQAAGGSVRWTKYADEEVVGVFSHPQGGEITISWDMERAKRAGLGGKDNWRKYPRQMLRARCISEGVQAVYPGVSVGMYTPEEVADFEPRQPEREIHGERVEPIRPSRHQLEADIDSAESLAALESLVPRIQQLPAEDRNALRARYATRKHLLGKAIDTRQEAELRTLEGADNWGDPQEAA